MKKRALILFAALLLIAAGAWGVLHARLSPSGQGSVAQRATVTGAVPASFYLTGSRVIPTVALSSPTTHCDAQHIPGVSSDPAGGTGGPAIKPHLCSIPTFTEQDVRQYVGSMSSFSSMRIRQISPHFTITRVLFITNEVANSILNADTGIVSDNLVVCYTEVYGDFVVESPFPGKGTKPAVMHHGQLVFDGVTGNNLVIGVEP